MALETNQSNKAVYACQGYKYTEVTTRDLIFILCEVLHGDPGIYIKSCLLDRFRRDSSTNYHIAVVAWCPENTAVNDTDKSCCHVINTWQTQNIHN